MRLIDADKIIEVAEYAWNEWNLAMATQDTNRGVNRVLKMQELCKCVKAVADDCPTIDPGSLRPRGKWLFKHDKPEDPAWTTRIVCSNCGLITGGVSSFCPNCGAKMEGIV